MISLAMLVGADFDQALVSLRRASFADEVLLGIERDRSLFYGGTFTLPHDWEHLAREAIGGWGIRQRVIEYSFGSRRENFIIDAETPLRNALSHLAEGDWIVHLDADEMACNPDDFREWLSAQRTPIDESIVSHKTVVAWKVIGDTLLIAEPARPSSTPVATCRRGRYRNSRNTGGTRTLQSPLRLLHWSYGRSREDVLRKLTWSAPYMGGRERMTELLDLWDSVTLENYGSFVDFWPFGDGVLWHRLRAVPLADALAGRI